MILVAPLGGVLISLAIKIGEHTYTLVLHLSKKEFKKFGKELLSSASTAIYLGSILTANPGLLFLSMSTQALFELGVSYGSYKEGKWPETLSNLLLAAIRLHGARPHYSRAKRQYFGRALTQEDAIRLLEKAEELHKSDPTKPIDFEELLKKENYSNCIQGIDYGAEKRLSSMRFTHIQFKDCAFAEIVKSAFNSCRFTKSDFTAAQIEDTSFDHCLFNQAKWVDAIVHSTFFSHCSLNDAVFYHATLDDVHFSHTSLDRACFNDSHQTNVRWENSSLKESIFLGAETKNCTIKDSDLTDAALCDATLHLAGNNLLRKTKPVVSITWEFGHEKHYAKVICDKLRKNGAMVLKYQGTPDDIDEEKLSIEITEGLARLSKEGLGDARSLGEALLLQATADSQIHLLNEKAAKINRYATAFLLPGGYDIEPELYGAIREEETHTEDSFRKSLLEMGLLKQAEDSDKKVMGICRGSQMINVYYGGTLNQHVESQMGVIRSLYPPSIEDSAMSKAREELFGKGTIYAISMHHQGVDRLGEGLHQLYQSNTGVPKAWMTENGRVLGTQFHPELYDGMTNYSKFIEQMLDKMKDKPWPDKKIIFFREVATGLRETSGYLQKLFQRFV
jgi:gamma-glutamyl-gamma-aminobutyrate hydrolase PuuD